MSSVGKIGPDVLRVMSPKIALTGAMDGASRASSGPSLRHELEAYPFYSSKVAVV